MHPKLGLAMVGVSLVWLFTWNAIGRAVMRKSGGPPRTSVLFSYIGIVAALLIAIIGLALEMIAVNRLHRL